MFDPGFIEKCLPPRYRKPKMIAWLSACLSQARTFFSQFETFRNRVDECRQYNSQTLSLESFLRIKLNNIGINIVNSDSGINSVFIFYLFEDQTPVYTYFLSEEDDENLPTIQWLSEEANSSLFYNFIVEVPSILIDQEDIIKGYLNKLKLAGKKYKIVYY